MSVRRLWLRIAFAVVAMLSYSVLPVSAQFKEGVDAGLSDFKSYNSDITSTSLGPEPQTFSNLISLANRVDSFIPRMKSAWDRIGIKLSGSESKAWAEKPKQSLLAGCSGMTSHADLLERVANEALEAANELKRRKDEASRDNSKQADVASAESRLNEKSRAVKDRIDAIRAANITFYDAIRDANQQFKAAIALATDGVAGNQAKVEPILNEARGLEEQIHAKMAEAKPLLAELGKNEQMYRDLLTKFEEKHRLEDEADRALDEAMKKDPPVTDSEALSLVRAAAAARLEAVRAQAEYQKFWQETCEPAMAAYSKKLKESLPLNEKISELKQRRDSLLDGLNKARIALKELKDEYQEPSL